MPAPSDHRSRLLATPWPGVHATVIDSARPFGRHWHDTHGVGLLVRGGQRSASGRGPVEAVAGDLITSNPGEVHDGRPMGGAARRWQMLFFEPGELAAWTGANDRGAADLAFVRPVLRDERLRQALLHVFDRLGQRLDGVPASLADEEAMARLAGTLSAGLLQQRRSTEPDGEPLPVDRVALRRVRERLADELVSPPSLAALAESLGCSRWQVLRRFEQAHGLSPHAWVQQLRLQRARALIRAGLGLAEAAAECGFADQSHMTRLFTRQFGYPPGRWRRNIVQDR